jgi:HEAT repeat protein
VIHKLLVDQVETVRLLAATAGQARPALHDAMLDSEDRWVRTLLVDALHDDPHAVSLANQRRLLAEAFVEARMRLAGLTPFGEVFEELMRDPVPAVRAGCASNPRITHDHAEALLTDRASGVRAAIVAEGLHYPTHEQLVRMTRDRSKYVRWAIIFRVDAPREALEALVEDADPDNRHHARGQLSDEHYVNAPEAIASVRAERASRVFSPFE